jgi:hypothetical protein
MEGGKLKEKVFVREEGLCSSETRQNTRRESISLISLVDFKKKEIMNIDFATQEFVRMEVRSRDIGERTRFQECLAACLGWLKDTQGTEDFNLAHVNGDCVFLEGEIGELQWYNFAWSVKKDSAEEVKKEVLEGLVKVLHTAGNTGPAQIGFDVKIWSGSSPITQSVFIRSGVLTEKEMALIANSPYRIS